MKAKPFLKWAGGKGRLLPTLLPLFPKEFGRYFEPFLGGGAVFFALRPEGATLSDINAELVNLYQVVRDSVEDLIGELLLHHYDRDHYLAVRALDPDELPAIRRAARTLYLNRTGFNGLYRVNRKGEFNVPFGKYTSPTICDVPTLRSASKALGPSLITLADYSCLGRRLRPPEHGDLVYFDPPYVPLTPTASFTNYSPGGFGEKDQRDLAGLFNELVERGVYCVASNSDTPLVRELYADHRITPVKVARSISCKGAKRAAVGEVIIRAAGDW